MGRVFESSEWIWIHRDKAQDEYAEFTAKIPGCKGKRTICRISCDGDYVLFLNGAFINCTQYGDFEHYKIYDEIDITELLQNETNIFSVLVWHYGNDSQRYISSQAGVIFEVLQGETLVLASNATVLCRKSQAYQSGYCKEITRQLGYSFLYDANKEDDWLDGTASGFDFAVTVNKNCIFYPRPIERLRFREKQVATLRKKEDKHFLIDLGEETFGVPVLHLFSETKQKIVVAWGEDLRDGHVRQTIGRREFSFEYIAKPGENTYINYLLRLGCRYLELYAEAPIELVYAGLLPQEYPVQETIFASSDPLEQKIYAICVRTLKLSMAEHYMDTPWREQCLYAFDARNQMLCGYYAFRNGNADYARANLKLIAEDRRADGLLSICYPCGADLTIPSFSLYYFMAVREYIDHTGDRSLAQEVYAKLTSVIEVFINNMQNGLVNRFSGKNHWNFYDWSECLNGNLFVSEKEEPDLILNCLFILALENLRCISKTIAKPFLYASVLEETRERVKQTFWNAEQRAFALTQEGKALTALGNALAILADVVDSPKDLCERMIRKEFTECSLSTKCFLYDALLKTDLTAYQAFIRDEMKRDYQKMLDAGATSVWETAEGASAFDNAGSLCHGWSAIPVYYYHKLSLADQS